MAGGIINIGEKMVSHRVWGRGLSLLAPVLSLLAHIGLVAQLGHLLGLGDVPSPSGGDGGEMEP